MANHNQNPQFPQTLTLEIPSRCPSPSLSPEHHDNGGDTDSNSNSNSNSNSESDCEVEFEFSFAGGENPQSPVSAEDVFHNGQIRPLFPYTASETPSHDDGPPVSKVFVAADEDDGEEYCEWSRSTPSATALASPEMRKKSNSTGFSKLWRIKDLLVRSNSDGKDRFVFLNRTATAEASTATAMATVVKGGGKKKKKVAETVGEAFEELYGKKGKGKGKEKEKGKSSSSSSSTYLPYRQDLVGFFTNGSGMTKNVHPY